MSTECRYDGDYDDKYLVRAGDFLIGMDGDFGCYEWRGPDALLNQRVCRLQGFTGTLLPRFLFYGLNQHLREIQANTTFTTVKHLSSKQVLAIQFPVPPLAEQERIVRILDDALTDIDQAKAHTESNILNLDALSQVTLDEVLDESCATGVRQAFSDVLSSQPRNGWSPPAANHAANGTPVLTLSSVTGFQFEIDKVKYTSAKTDPAAHYWVRDGDLLMTRSNTPRLVGHVALADGITEPTIYPDLIMRMRLNETQMLTPFAYFLLRTTRSREYLTSRAGGASQTMSKITKGTVQTMPVLVPSLEAQADAVSRLNHFMQGCGAARVIGERKATLLDQLRSATLARAFNGNL